MRQGPSLKVYCVIDKFLNRLLITFIYLSKQFRKVTWDQVGGLEGARLYIRRSVE